MNIIAKNPFTREVIEYPQCLLNFCRDKFYICHDTPFSERFSEWAVYILDTEDMLYIPYGQNRCRNVYIVTHEYINNQLRFPHGIYAISMNYFTEEIFI